MQGVPGHRASVPAAHDHHRRMLDMTALLNQGPDASLIRDQYSHGFSPAFCSPQFAGAASAPDIDHYHQSGSINGFMKVERLEGGAGEQSAVTNGTSASGEISEYSSSGERETITAATTGGDAGSTVQTTSMAIDSKGLTVAGKAKRKLPGMPDPDAEVIALSPKTLLATNRFVCEICKKGFQRDQNLQLHRRGHNLPWKLKLRGSKEPTKKAYVCPETSCVHHDPARALGDLTGIKKHFSRKHGEKKWKCDKCYKRYAVQSDWKAHSKICGTREYRCDCGTVFSRRDSFVTHRAFCDALAEESAVRVNQSGGHLFNADFSNNTTVATAMPQGHHLGNMIGGGPYISSHAKSHGLLDSSPFENSLVAATTPSSHTRLPSWLSHRAAPGDMNDRHQQLIGNPSQLNLPLNPTLILDSYNGIGGGGSSHYYSNSSVLPANASSLGQAYGPMYSNNVSEFDLVSISSNGNLEGMSSFNGLSALPSDLSVCDKQTYMGNACPSSAKISATSLLQKAAQLVTSSSPSLHKGIGVANSSDSPNPMYWPTSSNQGWNGLPSIGVNHSFNRGPSNGFGDKGNPTLTGDARRSNIMDSVAGFQEMLSSFNGGASAAFLTGGEMSSFFSKATPTPSAAMNNSLPILSTEFPTVPSQQALIDHRSSTGSKHSLMVLPVSIKGEDGVAADNCTRDFLGVRGDNGILESMTKSLSQGDLGMAHHYRDSKENLSSDHEKKISGQFHAK